MKKLIFIFFVFLPQMSFAGPPPDTLYGFFGCGTDNSLENAALSESTVFARLQGDTVNNINIEVDSNILCTNISNNTFMVSIDGGSAYINPEISTYFKVRTKEHGGFLIPFEGERLIYQNTLGAQWVNLQLKLNRMLFHTSTIAPYTYRIEQGDIIAKIPIRMVLRGAAGADYRKTIVIRAANSFDTTDNIQHATCDVDNKNIQVDMPNYVPGGNNSAHTYFSIKCGYQQRTVSYKISGKYEAGSNSIFSNMSTDSPSEGVGIQLSHSDFGVLNKDKEYKIPTLVGNYGVSQRLIFEYKTTGPIKPGNFQTIIGVNFTYN